MIRRRDIPQIALLTVIGLTLLLTGIPVAAQQNMLRVEFENDPSRSAVIATVQRGGLLFASLNDFASVFGLRVYENPQARKLELKVETPSVSYRIKVTANSPFISVTYPSPAGVERHTFHQLPVDAIYSGNSYYVPLEPFLSFFDVVFNKDAVYSAAAGVLRVRASAYAGFDFSTLRMEQKANGMLIRIPVSRSLTEFESWLKQDGWLYVTIADARADIAALNKLKPTGLVKKIVAIQSPTSVQLTFRLSGKIAAAEIMKPEGSNDILITIRTPGAEDKLLLESKQREILASLANQRKRWELDVIVIDAGHGGRDYGATGVTGVREKDVTLGVALKLGNLVKKHLPHVKVVYTRTDDSFVELDRRGRIANEAEGKLFISIHCNSLRRKPSPTRGFEVYLLRPGRTAEAVAIAERENSVIKLEEGYEERYKELTEENFILVSMAQSAHMKASEMFADIAQQEMDNHLTIPNRGVKQAGFYVLVGASMPNVLVETAYLSNREDERFLASTAGQQKIAEALLKAIKRYKEEYEKLLLEGKDMGENLPVGR